MTFDRPKPKPGLTLTSVRWGREGDHCRVVSTTYEKTRRPVAERIQLAPGRRPRPGLLL